MYEGCKGLLGLSACLLALGLCLLLVSMDWEFTGLTGTPEGEAASMLLSPLLGMLRPPFIPFWDGWVSFMCDCRPLLRLPLLLECISVACRCAEQLMCAVLV